MDAQVHDLAVSLGIRTVIHPPVDPIKRAYKSGDEVLPVKPFLERNRDLVNPCGLLLVIPEGDTETLRSGTWSTYRYAKKIHKFRIIIYPDGRHKWEEFI